MIVSLLAAGSVVVAAGAAVVVAVGGERRSRDRIRPYRVGATGPAVPGTGARWSDASRSWFVSMRTTPRLVRRLRDAGRADGGADAFRTRQYAHAGLGAAVGVGLGVVGFGTSLVPAVLAVVGGAVGFSRAPARLAREAEDRRLRMRLELATIDQILAIHVRTGAGPVQAVMRVVERGNGVVVDELRGILGSIRTGRSEADAFRHAAEITAEPHAARTYRLFALASEHGADLGTALRALSDDLRDVRRDELRRTATRRRAAMLVPTIAVLAPIMLLFVIAPIPSIVLGGR